MSDTLKYYVSIDELSKHINVKVSTLRAWVTKGAIPVGCYLKAGRTYRFCVSDVINALHSKEEIKPQPTVVQENDPAQLELDLNNPNEDL
jgi:excisionase family DNA binding protein